MSDNLPDDIYGMKIIVSEVLETEPDTIIVGEIVYSKSTTLKDAPPIVTVGDFAAYMGFVPLDDEQVDNDTTNEP